MSTVSIKNSAMGDSRIPRIHHNHLFIAFYCKDIAKIVLFFGMANLFDVFFQ